MRPVSIAAIALVCAAAVVSAAIPQFPAAARASVVSARAAAARAPASGAATASAYLRRTAAGSANHARRAQSFGAAVSAHFATARAVTNANPAAAPSGGVRDPGVPSFPYGWNTYWYTQRLDHFNFASTATFAQKYLVNDTFWDGSGPLFFYTGNEGPIELFANNTGFLWEVAAEFGALIVLTEHRYYGESLPFGAASFAPANLQYLTAEQALADYAEFLTWFKAQKGLDDSTRVVAFGGSYGGMLAAWFRIKYPAIVAGAISASAPILQFQESVSPYAFNDAVTADFAAVDASCSAAVAGSWQTMRAMSPQQLTAALGLCPGSYTQRSRLETDVFPWISNALVYMAMVDYPYPTTFLGPMPGYPVTVACRYLSGTTGAAAIPALAQAVGVFYNYSGEAGSCYNVTGGAADGPSTLADPGGWAYQSCTEMVMPMAQGGANDFFWSVPWNYTAFADGCFATYGQWPRPNWALQHFGGALFAGGLDMAADSNIVFSNGQLDPWLPGGVLQNLSVASNLVAIQYYGAHHLDLRAADPLDPQSVVDARNVHRYYLHVFLGTLPRSGLSNAQVAGITILSTIVGAAVAYAAYNAHAAAAKAARANPDLHADSYAPADVAPNAHKPATTTTGGGATGAAAVVSFDSPHHTPAAADVGTGPKLLNLNA